MSWLIEALRYIFCCGGADEEEPDLRQYERIHVYYPTTSSRNENQWRSHPSPPVIRSLQSHPPPPRPPPWPAAKPFYVPVDPSPPPRRESPRPQEPRSCVAVDHSGKTRLSTSSPSFVAFTASPSPSPAPAATTVSPTIPPPQPSKSTVSPSLPATKPPGPPLSPAVKPSSVSVNPSPPPNRESPRSQEPPPPRPSVISARSWVVRRSPLPAQPSESPSSSPISGDGCPKPSPSNPRSALPRYEIPEYLMELFKKDKMPPVLRGQLTPSTYADYFAALLYAEDYYNEKWSTFLLHEVMLELRSRQNFETARKTNKSNESAQMNKKDFVSFEIDSVPERRPYLLSRDFVFVQPLGKKSGRFKGVIFRVVKSTMVLVEFEDDFHAQHSSNNKYNVSFSFNRVCLKRSHCAVSAAKDPSFLKILFPDASGNPSFSYSAFIPPSYGNPNKNISRIINHMGPQPYLIEGPRSTTPSGDLSTTGSVIREAVLHIFQSVAHSRILICSPENRTCDVLMRSLQEIPKSKLFRANAAFREYELVPDDIIDTCLYKGECFSCPLLSELQEFKVITSTFMSSFRLCSAGLGANHFTHIFLVDASSAMEPEAIVTLINLVGKKTVVVVTGSQRDSPFRMRVRSDIGRRHGLTKSYFHRLLEREPYLSHHPNFFTCLKE